MKLIQPILGCCFMAIDTDFDEFTTYCDISKARIPMDASGE